jgi:hypothetical protein
MTNVVPWGIINNETNICENVCSWDGVTPWSPPDGYYVIAIGDSGAWIGFHYDPTTQVWTAPPSGDASFVPDLVYQNEKTTLSWTTQNATNVKLSTFGDQIFPANGSQDFTFPNAGSQTVKITMIGLAGEYPLSATAKVVLTGTNMPNISGGTVI